MDPESPLLHAKHIFRVAILLFLVIVILILGRGLFVPESWGEYGWYRGDSVDDHRSRPVHHRGDSACGVCHEEHLDLKNAGGHQSVQCEVCHSPITLHVLDGEVIGEMTVPLSLELCSRCHRHLNARPPDFPQVRPRQHLEGAGVELTENVCIECHDPHSPL